MNLLLTAWEDGYDWEYKGRVKRLDPISKMIDLEVIRKMDIL